MFKIMAIKLGFFCLKHIFCGKTGRVYELSPPTYRNKGDLPFRLSVIGLKAQCLVVKCGIV